jgi:hypothetical protein
MKVSIYKNLFDTKEGVEVDLETILKAIKSGRWKEIVNKHRAGEINAKNSKDLPAFTVGGVFHPKRIAENLVSPSAVMSFDLDNVTDEANVLYILNLPDISDYIYSIFKSLGGSGYCVLVKYKWIDAESYKGAYKAFYDTLIDLGIDQYCKLDWLPDLNRVRFVSYDPNMLIDPDSKIWKEVDYEFLKENKVEPKSISLGSSILEDDENALIKFAVEKYELASGNFGMNGKPRHDWILGLSRYLCRAGVTENSAINYCLFNYNNPDRSESVWQREVQRCVKSSYQRYSAESGSYAPTKKFDYQAINSESNMDGVLFQLLLFLQEKESYLKYLESEKKSNSFVEKEVQFIKTIYQKIKKLYE